MIGHDPARTYRAAIVGAGSGGLTVAIGLARMGHESVLIEGGRVGGDCTNVGCIPSKALLHAGRVGVADPFAWVRERRDGLRLQEEDELAADPHIHLVRGWARLTGVGPSPGLMVSGPDGELEVRADNVVISGGSRPITVDIPGLEPDRVLTNESLFDLAAPPGRVVVIGGGAIGLEMATAFRRLGSDVRVVELQEQLLATEDPLVGSTVREALEQRGVGFHLGTAIIEAREDDRGASLLLTDGETIEHVDYALMAIGRRPRLEDLGLDAAGVEFGPRGITVDTWGRTDVAGIWAVGDITGATQTTHGANAIGRRTARAIAFPKLPRTGSPRAMPSAVFCDPEIASVGLKPEQVEDLSASGRRRYTFHLADTDRGLTDDVRHGFVMVDVERFSGRVLRATVVGPSAAELIGMFTMAIDHGIGLRKLFGMVHPYPTYADAIGSIADDFALDTYPHLVREWWWAARTWASRRRNRPR